MGAKTGVRLVQTFIVFVATVNAILRDNSNIIRPAMVGARAFDPEISTGIPLWSEDTSGEPLDLLVLSARTTNVSTGNDWITTQATTEVISLDMLANTTKAGNENYSITTQATIIEVTPLEMLANSPNASSENYSITTQAAIEVTPLEMLADTTKPSSANYSITTQATTEVIYKDKEEEKQGLISTATKEFILEIVNCYLIPIVCPFGVAGNVLSLVALLCIHKGENSTTVLLVALTFSDLGYLLTTLMRKLSCVASKIDPERGWWLNIIFLPQVYMLTRVFNHVTTFITMVIAVERFLAVYLPLKVGLIVTKSRTIVAVVSIYVIGFALQGPFFFIYEIHWKTSAEGSKYPTYRTTEFYQRNEKAIVAYNNLVLSNILVFTPMAVVSVCTVMVLRKISSSLRFRLKASQQATLSSHTSKERCTESSVNTSDTKLGGTTITKSENNQLVFHDINTISMSSSSNICTTTHPTENNPDTSTTNIYTLATPPGTSTASPPGDTTTDLATPSATVITTIAHTMPSPTCTAAPPGDTKTQVATAATATITTVIPTTPVAAESTIYCDSRNKSTTAPVKTSAAATTTTYSDSRDKTTTAPATSLVTATAPQPKKKQMKPQLKRGQRKLTKMLTTIVVIYVVCNLPTAVTKLANYIEPEFSSFGGRYTNIFLVISGINILMLCVNSSVNFLIYIVTSSTIGTSFRRLLPRCFRNMTSKKH